MRFAIFASSLLLVFSGATIATPGAQEQTKKPVVEVVKTPT